MFTDLLGLSWGPANAEIDGIWMWTKIAIELGMGIWMGLDMRRLSQEKPIAIGWEGGNKEATGCGCACGFAAFTCPAFAWKFRANFSVINRTAESDLETPPTCSLLHPPTFGSPSSQSSASRHPPSASWHAPSWPETSCSSFAWRLN